MFQRVDKPSHSPAGLCAGTHECQIRSVPVLAFFLGLQRFSIRLKRQRAKIKNSIALNNLKHLTPKRQVFFHSMHINWVIWTYLDFNKLKK
ncbi:hypothetical protein CHI04_08805 [Bacillus safensis]|nr:hypothetical protein CHI04_08805 [Bacillus safensis]